MNYSDLDKFKYLNEILMIQFKNFIEREEANFEITKNDQHNYIENSNVDQISTEEKKNLWKKKLTFLVHALLNLSKSE